MDWDLPTLNIYFQAKLWVDRGLIDFSIDSVLNGIPLCATCHGQFDYALDPGLIFLPTDLQFFIDAELEDRKRRRGLASDWVNIQREVPDAERYRNHQIGVRYKGHQVGETAVGPDSIGGLYRPVFAKSYLHAGWLSSSIDDELTEPRPWHGAPLASLRRAIAILGTGRISALDETTRLRLERLRNMYFLDKEETHSAPGEQFKETRRTTTNEPARRETQSTAKRLSSGAPYNSPRTKRQMTTREYHGRQGERETVYCPVLEREVTAHWSLGPGCSSLDAIQLFEPLMRSKYSSADR